MLEKNETTSRLYDLNRNMMNLTLGHEYLIGLGKKSFINHFKRSNNDIMKPFEVIVKIENCTH